MLIKDLFSEYSEIYVPTIIDQKTTRSRLNTLLTILTGEVEDLDYEKLLNYRGVREGAGISPASVNKELTVLDSAIDWGERYQLLPKGFKLRVPTVSVGPSIKCIDGDAISVLSGAASDIRLACFIRLAFLTGARPTALKTLRTEQLRDGVVDLPGECGGIESRRKNRARIPLTKDIEDVVSRIREAFGITEYVFPGSNGHGYWRNIDREFSKLARQHGIDATCHTIRHSTATALIESGIGLLEVSRFLGHKSTAVTERIYIHSRPEMFNQAVSNLGDMIK